MEFVPNTLDLHQPPWRNWLARSAVNRKVGGSSPPGGAFLRSLAEPARTFFFPWEMFVPNEVKLSGPSPNTSKYSTTVRITGQSHSRQYYSFKYS